MKKMTRIVFLSLLSFLVFVAPANCAEPLQAHIQHSHDISPVSPSLRAGSQFNQNQLPKQLSNSKWFQIPQWMAGEWRRKEIYIKKYGALQRAQKDVRQHRYGYQTDAKGKIWHWVRAPYPVVTEQANTISYFLIKNEDLIRASNSKVIIKINWTTWVINKANRVISKVIQGVQVDTYKSNGEGALLAQSNVANYDQDGKLITRQNWFWKDDLMVYYEPVDQFEGKNVKQLFIDYLIKTKRTKLIPGR